MTLISERRLRERMPIAHIRPDLVVPLAKVERDTIESALILCAGNVRMAAERLGIGKSTLNRKMAEWRAEDAAPTD
jgi:DNA-binding NtrC family response regulator